MIRLGWIRKMNKLYLLPFALVPLTLGFASTESHKQNKKIIQSGKVINIPDEIADDPELMQEIENEIAELLQKKSKKQTADKNSEPASNTKPVVEAPKPEPKELKPSEPASQKPVVEAPKPLPAGSRVPREKLKHSESKKPVVEALEPESAEPKKPVVEAPKPQPKELKPSEPVSKKPVVEPKKPEPKELKPAEPKKPVVEAPKPQPKELKPSEPVSKKPVVEPKKPESKELKPAEPKKPVVEAPKPQPKELKPSEPVSKKPVVEPKKPESKELKPAEPKKPVVEAPKSQPKELKPSEPVSKKPVVEPKKPESKDLKPAEPKKPVVEAPKPQPKELKPSEPVSKKPVVEPKKPESKELKPAEPVSKEPVVQANPPKQSPPIIAQEPASGQTTNEGQTRVSSAPKTPGPEKCLTPYRVMHVGLRHSEARGVGYQTGYSTLEAFGIYNRNTSFMPFADIRGHVFNDGKFAGNVGIGGRTLFSSFNHVLGYYLYYDVRQGRHGLTPQQLSPGVELLGKRMEYRINAYFPFCKTHGHKYHFEFDEFDDHRIILKFKQQRALTGGDAEVGAHITQSTKYDVYAGAGPYYFSSSHASTWGGKVRLLGRFKQFVSLEASYTYDHLFGSIVQGSIGVSLPFGKKLKNYDKDCSSQVNLALSRAAFAPYRFEIPVVKRVTRREAAINPGTDDPWTVFFVNNTSSSDGTFESPFPTLAQAQNASGPNDMIYVFPGDGTTKGMNMGIVLKDTQDFFGSGIAHTIKTGQGKIKIPSFSSTDPIITNTAGSIVNLANGNEVSGFGMVVTVASSNAIDGTAGVHGAKIDHNHIAGSVGYSGINILGFGDIDIFNNQLFSAVISGGNGMLVRPMEGQFSDVNISNNAVNGFSESIILVPQLNPTTATGNILISGNAVSGFHDNGIAWTTGMPGSFVQIVNNMVANTVGVAPFNNGIYTDLNQPGDAGRVLISNNSIITTTTTADSRGIAIDDDLAGRFTSQEIEISRNTILSGPGAQTTGMFFFPRATNTICLSLFDNFVQVNPGFDSVLFNQAGTINIDNLSGNIGVVINTTGTGPVNLVEPGTCGNP